jgi:hypothetical protein
MQMKSLDRSKMLFPLVLLVLVSLAGCSDDDKSSYGLQRIAAYNGATLYITRTPHGTGHIRVIKMIGSFSEMGRQYGYLLKTELEQYYQSIIVDYLIGEKQIAYSDLVQSAEDLYADALDATKEFMQGVAETSELTLTQVQLINNSMIVAIMGCSAVVAWGEHTSGGPLIVGRNWDMNTGSLDRFKDYMMVTVYSPPSGNSVADINYMGQFQLFQTAINDKGLWIDMQNGTFSSSLEDESKQDPNAAIFQFLRNDSTMEEIDASFMTGGASASFIMTVADPNVAYSYFWCTQGTYRFTETDESGLLSTSNHFVEYPENWTINTLPTDPAGQCYTEIRRNNWLALANSSAYKGKITDETMKKILETYISDGGGTFPPGGYSAETVYQIIAVPQNLTLWMRLPKYFGWEKIELSDLFSKK